MFSRRITSGGLLVRRICGRRTIDGSGRGLVMLGGWTATVDYWGGEMPGNEDGVNITKPLAEYEGADGKGRGILTCSCATDSTWGNATIISRITTLVDQAQADGYFAAGTVDLLGNSMGTLCALNWADANPTRVNAIGLGLPAVNVQDIYDNDRYGTASSISAAYGGRPPDASCPATHPADFASFPIRMWYSDTDPVAIPGEVTAFAAGSGAETVDIGSVGHTWGDKSIFNGAALAEWFAAHA